jgi:hypothetical protein
MVGDRPAKLKKARASFAKTRGGRRLTGMLPVDPVARIDPGRRIRIERLRLAAALQRRHRRRRTAAGSPARLDLGFPDTNQDGTWL